MVSRILISILFLIVATTVAEAKKVALVIGNSAYRNAVELANPVNDAKAMTGKLERLGFEVTNGYDEDYAAMQQTVNSFAREAIGADIALLFYAGHGIQVGGDNYLIPIDAAFKDETSLDFEAIPVDFIIRQMSRNVRLRMIFLDACRDNPLAKTLARSMNPSRSATLGDGLAEIKIEDPGEGTVIAFATSPGDVAYDGKREHSPFTAALLDHIDAPDLPLQNVMTLVTRDVYAATNQRQRPWINASLIGEIYLNKREVDVASLEQSVASTVETQPGGVGDPIVPALSITATPDPSAANDAVSWDQEKTLFEFAQKSGAAEDFEAYLSAYPRGHFADIAKNFIMRSRSVTPAAGGVSVASIEDEALRPRRPFAAGTDRLRPERQGDEASVAAPAPPSGGAGSSPPAQAGSDLTEALLGWDRDRRREVQARLELEGIELGKPDGSFGHRTRQAVSRWQAGRGLPATGYFSQPQYEMLVSRTLQSYAVWEVEDRDRRSTVAAPSARSGKARSAERLRPSRPRPQRARSGHRREPVLIGRAPARRNNGDVAGAAFMGGLIGGAIGGAIGR